MSEPSFSICIPNYNYGRFIGDTIQSVLDQTYQNFEIIVADNASTDDSLDVVRSFADERIRIIQNRYNIGFAPNLQRATMYARNDFINLLSSDDQMKPTALEEYASILKEMGEDAWRTVLMSDAEGFDNDDRVTHLICKARDSFARVSLRPDQPMPSKTVLTRHRGLEVLRDRMMNLDAIGVFCSIVYPRTMWEAVEGYNSVCTIGPDKHFGYKLLSQDPIVVYVHKPLFRYRDYVSLNRAAVQTTIRFPIDNYLNVLEFGNENFLKTVGLSRQEIVRAMLDRSCLRESMIQLGLGNYTFAFRLFAFALATFPGSTLRMGRTYLVLPLLMLGPFSRIVAPPLRALYRRFQSRPVPFPVGGEH